MFSHSGIVLLCLLLIQLTHALLRPAEHYDVLFINHIEKHSLSIGSEEFSFRKRIFSLREDEYYLFNQQKGNTFKKGTNQFSHLTAKEIHDYIALGGIGREEPDVLKEAIRSAPVHEAPFTRTSSGNKRLLQTSDLPPSVDWRDVKAPVVVTPVKNQGSCGSCWTFAVSAVMV